MNMEENNFKFDSSVVPVFDEHVSQSVPMYDEFHKMIVEMAAWFIEDGTNVYDIGTSTGKTLKGLSNRYNKNVSYIGIDKSPDMIESVDKNDSIKLFCADVSQGIVFKNASLIASVLTLQFIRQDARQDIVNNIYKGLNFGGAFFLVEKIEGSNALFNEMWKDLHHDKKMENGLDEKHVIEKAKSIRGVMKPISLDDNIKILNEAGFTKIDTFLRWGNFVGLVAVK